jgi:RNA recognition motif-containing protein
MDNRLFVSNLTHQTTEATLAELFEAVGEGISVNIVTDQVTDRSLGFAFVEMAEESAARRAIRQLNGKTVDEQDISVAEAVSQRPHELQGS